MSEQHSQQPDSTQEKSQSRTSGTRPWMRVLRWAGWLVLGAVLLCLLALGALALRPDMLQPSLVRMAQGMGMRLDIEDMSVNFDPLELRVTGVTFDSAPESSSSGSDRLRVRVAHLVAELDPAGFLRLSPFHHVVIESPHVQWLAPDAQDKASSSGGPVAWWHWLGMMDSLELTRGSVHVVQGGQALFVKDLQASVAEVRDGAFRPLRVECRVSALGQDMDASARLLVQGQVAEDGTVRANLSVDKAEIHSDIGAGSAQARAEVLLHGDRLELDFLKLLAQDWTLTPEDGTPLKGLDLSVETSGVFELEQGRYALEDLKINADELVLTQGRCVWRDGWFEDLNLTVNMPEGADALERMRPLLPAEIRDVRVSGSLELGLGVEDDDLRAEVRPGPLRVAWTRHGLDAAVGGAVVLSGVPGGPWGVDGTLSVQGDVGSKDLGVRGLGVQMELAGQALRPEVSKITVTLPGKSVLVKGTPLRLGAVELTGGLGWDEKTGEMLLHDFLVREASMGAFTGQARVNLDEPLRSRAKLHHPGLSLAAMKAVLEGLELSPRPWPEVKGSVKVDLDVSPVNAGPRLRLGLRLGKGGFTTADGNWLAEKVSASLDAEAVLDGPVNFKARVDSGEMLLGTVFLNLTNTPLILELAAASASGDEVMGLRGRVGLESLAVANLNRGLLRHVKGEWLYDFGTSLHEADVPALFKTLVQDPMSFTRPELTRAVLDGEIALTAGIRGRGALADVTGDLALEAGVLRYPAMDLAVEGLGLDLPLAYHFGEPVESVREPSRWGVMHLDALALPTGNATDLEVDVAVSPNLFSMRGGLSVPVLGGDLTLADCRITEPFSPDFSGRLRAQYVGGDLSNIAVADIPVEGTLDGAFEAIDFSRKQVTATGGFEGSLFGGKLYVTELSVSDPFQARRIPRAGKITLRGLDLERLSTALGIGRITGRLDGHMNDFAVAYGQPQAFTMKMLTVPTDGVEQSVSLAAVNSISVMGTGSGLTDVGVGMFASFFKEFGYDAMGIGCTLVNDVFSVRGLIHDGGVEYLIKKPMLFGINVINGNPDNRISFSDMTERVQRVLHTAAKSQEAPSKEEP